MEIKKMNSGAPLVSPVSFPGASVSPVFVAAAVLVRAVSVSEPSRAIDRGLRGRSNSVIPRPHS